MNVYKSRVLEKDGPSLEKDEGQNFNIFLCCSLYKNAYNFATRAYFFTKFGIYNL